MQLSAAIIGWSIVWGAVISKPHMKAIWSFYGWEKFGVQGYWVNVPLFFFVVWLAGVILLVLIFWGLKKLL